MGSAALVNEVEERLNNELQQLVIDIQRVGEGPQVLFGELFDDDEVQQHYEGLAATLKAAKKRGIVSYKSPILLKGAHDNVMVKLCGDGGNVDLDDLKKSGSSARSKIVESVAPPSLEELKLRRAKQAAEKAPKKSEPAKPEVVEEKPNVAEEIPPVTERDESAEPKEASPSEPETTETSDTADVDADLEAFISTTKKEPSEPEPAKTETPDEANVDDDLEKFIAAKTETSKPDEPKRTEEEETPVSVPTEQDMAPAPTPSEDESVEIISETMEKKRKETSAKAPEKAAESKPTEPVMGHLTLGNDQSSSQSAPKEEVSTDTPKKKGRKSLMKKMFSRKSSSGKKKEAGTL